MGSIRNTRIVRFLLVIGAVVLTIFIYASYSTGTTQLTEQHMRAHMSMAPAAALLQQQQYQQQQQQSHQQLPNKSSSSSSSDLVIGPSYVVSGVNNSTPLSSSYNNNQPGGAAADVVLLNYNKHAAQHDSSGGGSGASMPSAPAASIKFSNKNSGGVVHLNGPKKQHRLPTIDVDAGGADVQSNTNDDLMSPADEAGLDRLLGNDMLEEQYVANVENAIANINNLTSALTPSVANNNAQAQTQQQQQLQQQTTNDNDGNNNSNNNNNNVNNIANKVVDADVLIPTSNLQKFIENADKILKNITVPQQQQQVQAQNAGAGLNGKAEEALKANNHYKVVPLGPLPEDKSKPLLLENAEEAMKPYNDDDDDDDEPEPPSNIMTIIRAAPPVEPVEEKKTAAPAVAPAAPAPAQKVAAKPPPLPLHGVPSMALTGGKQLAKTPAPAKSNVTIPLPPIDPTQGVPTEQIYESGHLNEELRIDKICPNQGVDLKLLILITSAQAHAEARLAIRQTWAHYGIRRDVSTAFVLGRSTNETLNLALTQENYIYGDLIRGNFIDSYNNLTLKTISSLEWVDQHCSQAKFILKTDDDMFINVPKLLSFLDSHAKDKRTIYGRLAKKWKPIRNKKSKYFVSTGQFSSVVFPAFTTGPAYVLTRDVVHDLYVKSLKQVYLKLEDVFTTGIVAQQLNIKRVHVNEFLNRRISFNPCNVRKAISVHMIKSNEQFDLWKKLLDQTTKCK